MDTYNNQKKDINTIKKNLSDELVENLRNSSDNVLEDLINHGYTFEEVIDLITRYKDSSGADLVNCNEVVKKSLKKK